MMKENLNNEQLTDSEIEFWKMIEEESSKLEVTCDYYLEEFYNL